MFQDVKKHAPGLGAMVDACAPGRHVLAAPVPAKWQAVLSPKPIARQVAKFVELPSVHMIAA